MICYMIRDLTAFRWIGIIRKKGGSSMRNRLMALLLTFGMVCTLGGCKTEEKPVKPEPTPSPVEDPKPVPSENEEPDGINPLTGLPMDFEYVDNRPIAVMLNNLKAAQPQLGISKADIIYEIPAEGGITRMVGVFQTLDGVETLGSIRSTRPYYLELALGHDALLVHAGGSPEAYQNIRAWGVDNMDGVRGGADAEIFWRDPDRKKKAGYEHSLLTSGDAIQEFLAGNQYRTKHLDGYTYEQRFAEDGTPINGADAAQITLNFSKYKTGKFSYNPDLIQYVASQYGAPYIDGNTGSQPGFTNVLVLETSIYVIKGDNEGRLAVDLTGEGKGTFFCGGKAVPIRWSKAGRSSQFIYTNEDGSPLTLGAGNSYICIMNPNTSTLSYE